MKYRIIFNIRIQSLKKQLNRQRVVFHADCGGWREQNVYEDDEEDDDKVNNNLNVK